MEFQIGRNYLDFFSPITFWLNFTKLFIILETCSILVSQSSWKSCQMWMVVFDRIWSRWSSYEQKTYVERPICVGLLEECFSCCDIQNMFVIDRFVLNSMSFCMAHKLTHICMKLLFNQQVRYAYLSYFSWMILYI